MRNMIHILPNIESPYYYNNRPVPRVNTILSDMINEQYLIEWSNRLGFARKNYHEVVNLAADKGTYTHDKIDHYLKTGEIKSNDNIPNNCIKAVNNAFSAFLKWWKIITENNDVEILFGENTMVCNLFGGTVDLVLKINGRIYVVDFKTSNQPSYRYLLQLSAYDYLLEYNHNIKADGWIILMLNKNYPNIFNELLIKKDTDNLIMNHCKEAFMSIVNGYYNKLEVIYYYDRKFNV